MTFVLLALIAVVTGVLIGALIFGSCVALYFLYRIKIVKHPIGLIRIAFLGTAYVERPFYEGFGIGSAVGIIFGILTGISICLINVDTWYFALLFGIILEAAMVVIPLVISDNLGRESAPFTIFLLFFFSFPAAASFFIANLLFRVIAMSIHAIWT